MFTWRFIRVWQRNRDVFVKLWRSEAAGYLIEPVFVLLTMGIGLGAFIGQVDGWVGFNTGALVLKFVQYFL